MALDKNKLTQGIITACYVSGGLQVPTVIPEQILVFAQTIANAIDDYVKDAEVTTSVTINSGQTIAAGDIGNYPPAIYEGETTSNGIGTGTGTLS